MINYQQKQYWKIILLLLAISISLGSLLYTKILVTDLSNEQFKMINLLAESFKQINQLQKEGKFQDISFPFYIVKSNENIPLILTDSNLNILDHFNLQESKASKPGYLERQLKIMKFQHEPIEIEYSSTDKHLIFYKNSKLITQLKIYPFVQLLMVIIFILVAYSAFNSSRKYEQNKVWTGMSRETAHQLGTPVSSLIALSENIKASGGVFDQQILSELDKDIERLETITERFAKIGTISKPELLNVYNEIAKSLNYLRPRLSKQVKISFSEQTDVEAKAFIIPSLFDWVIENICKNAVNAMEGQGQITISIQDDNQFVLVDISDSGKGIPKYKQKTIFKAGYTTNKRGWGLGLSLSKRIINLYHKGDIFVKSSELGKGSTFRVKLRK